MKKDKSSKVPVSKLVVLFPFTYCVHIIEEYYAGFYNWLALISNTSMTADRFLLLNSIFMLIMLIATSIAIWRRDHQIPLILASVVTINSLLHIFGSIVTFSYSPGVISAVILWVPLAVLVFNLEWKNTSVKQKLVALTIGIIAHVVVSLLALEV